MVCHQGMASWVLYQQGTPQHVEVYLPSVLEVYHLSIVEVYVCPQLPQSISVYEEVFLHVVAPPPYRQVHGVLVVGVRGMACVVVASHLGKASYHYPWEAHYHDVG